VGVFERVDQALLERQFIRSALPTPQLDAACLEKLGATPQVITISTEAGAKPLRCFWNVRERVAKSGGEIVFGWALFEWPHLFWEAQHHAVWKRPDEQLVDITPPAAGGTESTLFVQDDDLVFDFEWQRVEETRRFPLADWQELRGYSTYAPLIHQRRELVAPELQQSDRLLINFLNCERSYKEALLVRLANVLSHEEPCFCGSGSEFGGCCMAKFS
jgi:hypothetical protein